MSQMICQSILLSEKLDKHLSIFIFDYQQIFANRFLSRQNILYLVQCNHDYLRPLNKRAFPKWKATYINIQFGKCFYVITDKAIISNIIKAKQNLHNNEGQGIGLFLAKKIADAAGGNIILESELEKAASLLYTLKLNL